MKLIRADEMLVKVDDADYPSLCGFEWHIKRRTKDHLYVYRYEKRRDDDLAVSRFRAIRIHRQIMGFPKSGVDHWNGDTLDNQRHNLRMANQREQAQNTRRRNGKKFKGVTFCPMIRHRFKCKVPWRARIRVNGKLISLGYFESETEAAIAYNRAARIHFGLFACVNEVVSI